MYFTVYAINNGHIDSKGHIGFYDNNGSFMFTAIVIIVNMKVLTFTNTYTGLYIVWWIISIGSYIVLWIIMDVFP